MLGLLKLERETDRQTDRQRQRQRQRKRDRDRETERQRQRDKERQKRGYELIVDTKERKLLTSTNAIVIGMERDL